MAIRMKRMRSSVAVFIRRKRNWPAEWPTEKLSSSVPPTNRHRRLRGTRNSFSKQRRGIECSV